MISSPNKKSSRFLCVDALALSKELISEEKKTSSTNLFTFNKEIEKKEEPIEISKPKQQMIETQSTSIDDEWSDYQNIKKPKRRDATTNVLNFTDY